ncbi:MAG: DUF4154 domain-containing protein [Marinilabiliaceae bacterium]|nr:DUF4154 domain-containing protein [Marinilabiliaceae bacterium]
MRQTSILYCDLVFILFLCFIPSLSGFSQVKESKVKAVYLYQLAQQINWPNEKELASFRIGLLTNDSAFVSSGREIAKSSHLKKKPIEIIPLQINSLINNLQILFVDESYAQSVPFISDRISENKTLFITYNSSDQLFYDINVFRSADTQTLSFEVNLANLRADGFTYNSDILVLGGSLVDLKAIYKESIAKLDSQNQVLNTLYDQVKSLNIEKKEFQNIVKELRYRTDSLSNDIKLKENHLDELSDYTEHQNTILAEREMEINHQTNQLSRLIENTSKQEHELSKSEKHLRFLNNEIETKKQLIDNQKKELSTQLDVISVQQNQLSTQRRFLIVSIILAFTFIIAIIAVVIALRLKHKLSKRLKSLVDKKTRELEISRQYYRSLIEYSPVSLFEFDISHLRKHLNFLKKDQKNQISREEDRDMDIIDALSQMKLLNQNQTAKAFTGEFQSYRKEEIIKNIIDQNSSESILIDLQAIDQKDRTHRTELQLVNENGDLKNAIVSWILLPDESGVELNRLLIALLDISKMKQYERALQQHQEELEMLVKKRTQKISDLNTKLSSANDSLNLKNKNLFKQNVLLEEQRDEISNLNKQIVEANTGLTIQKEEVERTYLELKETQLQLIESEKMASLGMLTAGVAHEINNPINFISAGGQALGMILSDIKLHIDALSDKYESVDTNLPLLESFLETIKTEDYFHHSESLLENIYNGIERTSAIINSLNIYSHDSTEVFEQYPVAKAIDSALVMLQAEYKHKVVITKNYIDTPVIDCWPGKLNQVFVNIISNAIQAITKTGHITIKMEFTSDQSQVKVIISDDGQGMSESTLKKIFDPFFTTKQAGQGTGLGLYITYSIIVQHKGSINMDSILGKGTDVTIILPLKQE